MQETSIRPLSVLIVEALLCCSIFVGCSDLRTPFGVEHNSIISPKGDVFAISLKDRVVIYDVATRNKISELNGTNGATVKFSPDSNFLVSSDLTALTLWDWRKTKKLAMWKGKNRWAFLTAFSGDSSCFAAADDESLRVWKLRTLKMVLKVPLPYEMGSLALSPKGNYVAVAGTETKSDPPRFHEIKVWNLSTRKVAVTLRGSEYCIVKAMGFSPNGQYLATSLSVNETKLWDLKTRKTLWKQAVKTDYGILTFSPRGEHVIVGGHRSLYALETISGKVTKKYELQKEEIISLTTLAKPIRLVITTNTRVLSFELQSGERQQLFPK